MASIQSNIVWTGFAIQMICVQTEAGKGSAFPTEKVVWIA